MTNMENTLNLENNVILKLNNVKKYFPLAKNKYQRACDGISLELHEHEIIGLVGESGCGKTTLGRSIVGLYRINDGEIYYKNQLINSSKKGFEALNVNEIQMIFQDPYTSLNPRMTIYDIVAEGLIIQGIKDKKEIRHRVEDVLAKVGISLDYLSSYPHELSGGQRQRIGIARALIMKPKVIIADEPVSALDVSIQAQILNLLSRLSKEMDLSILFIAHNLGVVKYFCNRIAVMYQGKIVEYAPKEELFKNPLHPYTKSLLSAVCEPDPIQEKNKKRITYSSDEFSSGEDYSLVEVGKKHYVYLKREDKKNE